MQRHAKTADEVGSKHQKAVAWANHTNWFTTRGIQPPQPSSQTTNEPKLNAGWKMKQAKNYGALLMRIVVVVWIVTTLVIMCFILPYKSCRCISGCI